jgi:hypothetical protein
MDLLNLINMNAKSFNRTFVSRSKFQKVVEENKRMKKDLRILCGPSNDEECEMLGETIMKWNNYFRKEDKENAAIKEILCIGRELVKEGKI